MAIRINPKFLEDLDAAEEEPKAQEQTYTKWWRPETEGDRIAGYLKSVTTKDASWGQTQVAVLDTPDGVYEVTLFKSLESQWKKAKPRKGDLIGIKYTGDGVGQNGTYKKFILRVQSAADPFEED